MHVDIQCECVYLALCTEDMTSGEKSQQRQCKQIRCFHIPRHDRREKRGRRGSREAQSIICEKVCQVYCVQTEKVAWPTSFTHAHCCSALTDTQEETSRVRTHTRTPNSTLPPPQSLSSTKFNWRCICPTRSMLLIESQKCWREREAWIYTEWQLRDKQGQTLSQLLLRALQSLSGWKGKLEITGGTNSSSQAATDRCRLFKAKSEV